MSIHAQQIRIAEVLIGLLRQDLPVASWSIGERGTDLVGQIPSYVASPDVRRDQLRAWAEFFGAQINVVRYERNAGGNAEVLVEYEGVRVRVWSPFLKKDLPKTGGDLS